MLAIVRSLGLRGVLQALDFNHILLLPGLIYRSISSLILGWLSLASILSLSCCRGYQVLFILGDIFHFLASGGTSSRVLSLMVTTSALRSYANPEVYRSAPAWLERLLWVKKVNSLQITAKGHSAFFPLIPTRSATTHR